MNQLQNMIWDKLISKSSSTYNVIFEPKSKYTSTFFSDILYVENEAV